MLNISENIKNLNLIPCNGKTKHPTINWTEYKDKKYDGEIKTEDIGAITGFNNHYVLDIDDSSFYDDNSMDKINTFTVKTGKGYHLHFKCLDGEQVPKNVVGWKDKIGRSIDVRGVGGFIMLPPSKHYNKNGENDCNYEVYKDVPIIEYSFKKLKEKLLELGVSVNTKKSKPKDIAKKGSIEGNRNDDMYKALANARDHLDYDDMEIAGLAETINKKNSPPLLDSELQSIVNSVISRVEKSDGRLKRKKSGKNEEDKEELIESMALEFIDKYRVEVDKEDFKIQIYEYGYYKTYKKEQLAVKLTEVYSLLHSDANEVAHWVLALAEPIKTRICGPYIRFNNGLYNYEEKQMEEFSPEKYTTVSYDFDMMEDPEPEEFLDAMAKWFTDEKYRGIAYKVIYESLLPRKSLKFHQLLGNGGNGKTQFRQMISELIPNYAVTTKLDLLVNDTFSSTVLDGNTVILCSEAPDNIEQFDMIKRITGDDIISIRGMRQAPKQITNMATLLLDSNQSVKFDESLSMKDRIHVVPFLNRIRSTDEAIEDYGRKLSKKEQKEIICWILQNKHIPNIEWLSYDECTVWIKEYGDSIDKFIHENYIITDNDKDIEKGKNIYTKYKRWCRKLGKSECNRTKFYEGMDDLEIESDIGMNRNLKFFGIKQKEKTQTTL